MSEAGEPIRPETFPAAAETAEAPLRPSRPSHKLPASIGPYRILECIGEGGMGIVYRAEQREPVRRVVALKVIKLGMDTTEVVARFEAERQALALMSHPNVAKVFEASTTANGRPYFAMEHVPGVPLTDYCDQNKLTIRERLELFIPVCQAVQHAHQKGIIHRDLKPSNILVTLVDGKPVPKVIDFGIAKATNQTLTQHTLFTQTGALVGTPEYMSPEQAMTSGLDVDTRTDIYSLGVILYELLTGTLPFDAQTLRSAGLQGMARIIKESDPPKPSTRLITLSRTHGTESSDLSRQVADRHGTDLRALQRELKGDLDWIVLKALEKDRTRRYETANGLATDVRRYLENEPISARPPSAAYRLQKLVRRNRAAVIAAAAVFLSLILGITGTTVELIKARRAQAVAVIRQREAEQRGIEERQARQDADTQRKKAEAALAAMYPTNGFREANVGNNAMAALWFAAAAQLAGADTELATTNATRADHWARAAMRPVAAFSTGSAAHALIFSPSGRYMLVQAQDATDPSGGGACSLWDLDVDQQITIPAEFGRLTAVAWSGDERQIALGSDSGELWVCTFPQFLRLYEDTMPGRVRSIAFGPDGKYLTAAGGNVVRTLDNTTHQPSGPDLPHPAAVVSVTLAAQPQRIVTTCADSQLRVFGLPPSEPQPLWAPIPQAPNVLPIVLNDGTILSSWGIETMWHDGATGVLRHTARFQEPVRAVSAAGDQVAVATGLQVRLLDAVSGRELRAVDGPSPVNSLAFAPDGLSFSAAAARTISRWSSSGIKIDAPPAHASNVAAIAWSASARFLASADEEGLVRVWAGPDARTTALLPALGMLSGVRFSRDDKYAVTTGFALELGSQTFTAQVYATQNGSPQGPPLIVSGSLRASLFCDDGSHVCTVAGNGGAADTIELWDWRIGKRVARMNVVGAVASISLSPDGSRLLVLSSNRAMLVLDAHTLAVQRQTPFQVASLNPGIAWDLVDVASGFSPDGHWMFAVRQDSIEIMDVASGRGRAAPIALDAPWARGVFLPDNRHLVVGGLDNRVRVFDTETGQVASSILSTLQTPIWLDPAPDGRTIFVGAADNTARLWDWQAGRLICPPLDGAVFGGVLPNERVITISPVSGVRLWEGRHGTLLAPPAATEQSNMSLAELSDSGQWAGVPGTAWTRLVDLSDWVRRPPPPPAMAALEAELFSGQRLGTDAGLVPLTNAQWLEHWHNYRSHAADLVAATAGQVRNTLRAWDREVVVLAQQENNDYAQAFHLSRLASLDVATAEERAALARLDVRRGNWDNAAQVLAAALQRDPDNASLHRDYAQVLYWTGHQDQSQAQAAQALAHGGSKSKWLECDWWKAGPYPEGFPDNFMAGDRLDVKRPLPPFPGSIAPAVTRWVRQGEKQDVLALSGALSGPPHTTTYAQQLIYCLAAREVAPNVAINSSGKIWINGQLVFEHASDGRSTFPAPAKLSAGWNRVLVRFTGGDNQWISISFQSQAAQLAIREENRGALEEAAEQYRLAIADDAKNLTLRDRYAQVLARLGQFKDSAAEYQAAIDLAPDDHFVWYRAAATLAYVNDSQGYNAVRTKMLAKYASPTAPELCERTAKACLLLPAPGDELARAAALADRAITLAPNHGYLPYFRLAKGLGELRLGHTDSAILLLTQARQQLSADFMKATSGAWLAVAQLKAGHTQEAREAYDAALKASATVAAKDSRNEFLSSQDWLICQIALREARAAFAPGNSRAAAPN